MKERTPLVVGAALLAVLVIIAILASSRSDIETLDRATPAGTVQAFVAALLADDRDAAEQLLAPEAEDPCLFEDVDWVLRDARVSLGDVDADDVEATVHIRTSRVEEGALTGSTYDSTFELERIEGDWRIVAADWPYGCGLVRVEEGRP